MKNRISINWIAIVVTVMVAAFIAAQSAWAGDWHALRYLSDEQLEKKISEFQMVLEQDPANYEAIKGLGIAYHIKATSGSKDCIKKAVKFLSMAYEKNRKDYVVMCYLGSTITMRATTTWNPIKKLYFVNKGTGLMDKAVRRDPTNVSVRMTRAHNSKSLPAFLNRGEIALEDFEYLADLIGKMDSPGAALKKDVYTNLAELYEKAGDNEKAERFRKLAKNQ